MIQQYGFAPEAKMIIDHFVLFCFVMFMNWLRNQKGQFILYHFVNFTKLRLH